MINRYFLQSENWDWWGLFNGRIHPTEQQQQKWLHMWRRAVHDFWCIKNMSRSSFSPNKPKNEGPASLACFTAPKSKGEKVNKVF